MPLILIPVVFIFLLYKTQRWSLCPLYPLTIFASNRNNNLSCFWTQPLDKCSNVLSRSVRVLWFLLRTILMIDWSYIYTWIFPWTCLDDDSTCTGAIHLQLSWLSQKNPWHYSHHLGDKHNQTTVVVPCISGTVYITTLGLDNGSYMSFLRNISVGKFGLIVITTGCNNFYPPPQKFNIGKVTRPQ